MPTNPQSTGPRQGGRVIVGFPAGGSVDRVARLLVSQMKGYAPSIVVENKAGAGGRLALDTLKHSGADGSVSHHAGRSAHPLSARLSGSELRSTKDFIPVTTVCGVQFVLAVGPLVPEHVQTLTDFIAWSKANPKLAPLPQQEPGRGRTFSVRCSHARPASNSLMCLTRAGLLRCRIYLAGKWPRSSLSSQTSCRMYTQVSCGPLPPRQSGAALCCLTCRHFAKPAIVSS